MKYCVYRGLFKNGKMYIGITNNYKRRLREHKHSVNKQDRIDYPLYKAIKKYGWDSIEWSIIMKCDTLEEAKEAEVYFIERYDLYNKKGYNASKGGDYPSEKCYVYSDDIVNLIVSDLKTGEMTLQKIADKHKVSLSYVSNILNNKIRNKEVIHRNNLQSKKGSKNIASKLDENKVSEIKKRLILGESRKKLEKEFEVSKSTIQGIAVGDTWKHVEPKIPMKKKRNRMTKDVLLQIKSKLDQGESSFSIQKEFKVSPNTVVKVKKGEYDHLLK